MKQTAIFEKRPSHTKIVATIGPASESQEQLTALINAGVDVFRLNMAHGAPAMQAPRLAAIRAAAAAVGRPIAVLTDLAGPKMRLGEIPGDQLTCNAGQQICFVRGNSKQTACAASKEQGANATRSPSASPSLAPSPSSLVPCLTTTYEPLLDELAVGDRILLADGTVSLDVVSVEKDKATCRVTQPGTVRSRQGVNLPGVKLSVRAMSDVDRENAVWAAKNGVDFIGLSFVRRGDEITELKSLIAQHNPDTQVIAKIEKPEALEHLEEIVAAADGVMVARGDLGVETDIARVAVAQKEIIAACRRHRKPVIVATQMLDSMTHSRIPTRAEVTDVTNAILDGADACMLSGETAVGDYPIETVAMMHRIALEAETLHEACHPTVCDGGAALLNPITEATVSAAGELADALNAKVVVIMSASGATALSVSKKRRRVHTLGISDSPATLRRMCLYWGVIPVAGVPTDDGSRLLHYLADRGREENLLHPGDRIVLVAGTGLRVTRHNMIVVHEID